MTNAANYQINETPLAGTSHQRIHQRIDWVDYAKGLCIIFVVMMHSTLGVGKYAGEEGWMHYVVEWARPFRMPDFFMVAGLFLAVVIDRDWRKYLDKKVLHFAYFYILWVLIQMTIKAPLYIEEHGLAQLPYFYLKALVLPFGTLWFIYMLPVMFVITKLLRPVPWYFVLAAAAALELSPLHTGIVLIDEFASRYVYFFAGYIFAQHIFRIAAWTQANRAIGVLGIIAWFALNTYLVFSGFYAQYALIGLMLGALGALAIILTASLLATLSWASFLRICGENSIVIYLAFFFPMMVTRTILLKTGIITDIGTISAIVTTVSVISPLILHMIIQKIGFGHFLFKRPEWATMDRLLPQKKTPLVPGE